MLPPHARPALDATGERSPMTMRPRSTAAARAFAILAALLVLLPAPPSSASAAKQAYHQGRGAMDKGDWDWAVVYLQKAVDLRPERADYKFQLARAKQRAAFAHFELAKQHLAAGNLEPAIAELQQTVNLMPSHQYAYVELEKAVAAWKLQHATADDDAKAMDRMKREADAVEAVPKLDPASNIPIRFELENKTIKEIFRVISDVSNISVIFDEGVQADKTSSLVTENVTLEEALDLFMLRENLAFKVLNDHTILVYQDNQTKQREYEDQIIRTFYMSNADVKDINTILRTVVDLRKTAINEQLNSITILDTADKIAIAGKLIEANDKSKAELIIDLEILEVNRTKLKQYGIDIRAGGTSPGPGINSSVGFDDDQVRLNNLDRLGQLGSWIVSPIPTAVIQLLRSDSDTKTLSRPQVRVTDGDRVTLHLGDQVPIPNTTFNTSNTSGSNIVPVTSYTYQNTGIQVQLEPRVHHNREITLKLNTEISSVAGVNASGQPTIGTREVETVIRLGDGETNLLAGLFQQKDDDSLRGLPGVVQIPFLRRLFGSTSQQNTETEIVMTVTPHIVRVPDISVADLTPLQVGTERDRRLRGTSHMGVGGSPFRNPDEDKVEDPFTSLTPGAHDTDRQRLTVPDIDIASGIVTPSSEDPLVITDEYLRRLESASHVPSPEGAAAPLPATPGGSPHSSEPTIIPSSGSAPRTPASPAPASPVPASPVPASPAPASPAPASPAPASPAPASPAPASPAPASPAPASPSPAPPAPAPSGASGAPSTPPPNPGPSTPTGPAVLTLRPSALQLRVGERITVDVTLEANGNEIASVPYHLVFDPNLLRVVSVSEGSFFRAQGANTLFIPEIQPGRVIIGHSQFGGSESVSGSGVLATLTVEGVAPGSVSIAFENAAILDRIRDRVPFRTEGTSLRVIP
jgi:general secretion pathway protein D